MQSQQKFLYPVNFTLQFSHSNPPKTENRKSCSWSLLKFLLPAPVFSPYPKYHHEIKPNPTPTNPIVDPQDCCYGHFKIARNARKSFFFPVHQWAHKFICYCTHKQSETWEWGKGGTFPFTFFPPSPSAVIQPLQFRQFNLEFMRFHQIFNNSKLHTKELEFAS